MVVPAVCNAYAESRLNPEAEGDSGKSVGLFQLHESGAGKGMSVEARKNSQLNTRRIIEVCQGPDGAALRAARGKSPNWELTRLFAHHIERCYECGWNGGSAQLDERQQLTYELYGDEIAEQVPT